VDSKRDPPRLPWRHAPAPNCNKSLWRRGHLCTVRIIVTKITVECQVTRRQHQQEGTKDEYLWDVESSTNALGSELGCQEQTAGRRGGLRMQSQWDSLKNRDDPVLHLFFLQIKIIYLPGLHVWTLSCCEYIFSFFPRIYPRIHPQPNADAPCPPPHISFKPEDEQGWPECFSALGVGFDMF